MFFKYKHIHPRSFFFFFNDTATTEIYTLSLHDALPISIVRGAAAQVAVQRPPDLACRRGRIALEQRLGRHHHAVAAVAALAGLLLDERALQRVQLVERAEAFDGGDRLLDGRHRGYA